MSTFLIVANIVFFAVAFYINARQVKRTNVRMWLRIPAAFISAYICIVYMLALIGILTSGGHTLFYALVPVGYLGVYHRRGSQWIIT